MRTRLLILGCAVLLVASWSFAQANNAQSGDKKKPETIEQRKQNQQDRVANGVKSGQLTAGETKRVEQRQANINQNERQMRAADSGKLTAADRSKLDREQDRASKQIYDDKHNAKTATYGNNQVGQRRENQQERLAQGIKSGQITPGGAAKQEGREQALNHQVSADRQANGGKLTAGQRQSVNQQQNKQSQEIHNEKHNAATGH